MRKGLSCLQRTNPQCTDLASRAFLSRIILLGSLLLFIQGCDTLIEEEPLFVVFTFDEIRFAADGISSGEAVLFQTSSPTSLDLGPELERDFLSKSDIVSAEVIEADLRILFPVQSDLDILDDVQLNLDGTTVAEAGSLPSSRTATLALTGANVASIVRGASFQASLRGIGASGISEQVTIEGRITLQVEVTGSS